MTRLWVRMDPDAPFPSDAPAEARARLAEVMDPGEPTSPWARALGLLGYQDTPPGPALAFWGGTPYLDLGFILSTLSGGIARVVETDGAGYEVRSRASFFGLVAVVRSHWRLEGFLNAALGATAPDPAELTQGDALARSLALGLALLTLTQRLPAHTDAQLAAWLADPDTSPARVRGIVRMLQRIQGARGALQGRWREVYPQAAPGAASPSPPWFWEDEDGARRAPAVEASPAAPAEAKAWKGLPVHPGLAQGEAWLVEIGHPPPARGLLVFRHADPDATLAYGQATGLIFARGAPLSHACTVAREQRIPAVTGVGEGLIRHLEAADGPVRLKIDGGSGQVEVAP